MEKIIFREYRPEDHEGFVACLNDFYAGGYPYPYFIENSYMMRMIENGEMIVTVALSESGQIVGTVGALNRSGEFDGGILLMLRSVLTAYRGDGIASRQFSELLERIYRKFTDARCIYADVMTHDTISQTSLIHRDYTFCGLRCMAYKNELIAPKINFGKGTKMTQAVFAKALDKSPVSVYVPEEHKEIIGKIYSNLGVDAELKTEAPAPEGKSEYIIEQDDKNEFAEFIISKAGLDFNNIAEELSELLKKNLTIIVYLNMIDKGSNYAYNVLEDMGFYFSGISPLFNDREYIILSQTDNCVENFQDVGIVENKDSVINYILGGRKSDR